MDTQKDEMTRMEIRRAMAESGRCTITSMMRVMKYQYEGRYDKQLARAVAKELVSQIPNH